MAQALAVISIISAVSGAVQQFKSAKEAKKAGERNAQMEEEMAAEEGRRTALEQAKVESTAAARAAASGVKSGGGSVAGFLENMKEEHDDELAWIKKSGARRADIARQEGKSASTQAKAGGLASLGGIAGQAYDWWK